MYVASETVHFYVNELALLRGGQLVIPRMWIIRNGELCADAFFVSQNDDVSTRAIALIDLIAIQGTLVIDETVRNIRAVDLHKNYERLLKRGPFLFSGVLRLLRQ